MGLKLKENYLLRTLPYRIILMSLLFTSTWSLPRLSSIFSILKKTSNISSLDQVCVIEIQLISSNLLQFIEGCLSNIENRLRVLDTTANNRLSNLKEKKYLEITFYTQITASCLPAVVLVFLLLPFL